MSSKDVLRIMLVDDHPITRRGLREVLTEWGGFDVVAQRRMVRRRSPRQRRCVPM